jgi:hypothetical protein
LISVGISDFDWSGSESKVMAMGYSLEMTQNKPIGLIDVSIDEILPE